MTKPHNGHHIVTKIKNYFNLSIIHNYISFLLGQPTVCFNIMGNHYRIIVKVLFQTKTVYVRFVGKHKDYDKINVSFGFNKLFFNGLWC